jgi:hypothetical protein
MEILGRGRQRAIGRRLHLMSADAGLSAGTRVIAVVEVFTLPAAGLSHYDAAASGTVGPSFLSDEVAGRAGWIDNRQGTRHVRKGKA